jgi:hypothetical protein
VRFAIEEMAMTDATGGLGARMRRLERGLVGLAVFNVATLLLAAHYLPVPGTGQDGGLHVSSLEVEQLLLRDRAGKVRAWLSVQGEEDSAALTLGVGEAVAQSPRAVLSASGLWFVEDDNKTVAFLSAQALSFDRNAGDEHIGVRLTSNEPDIAVPNRRYALLDLQTNESEATVSARSAPKGQESPSFGPHAQIFVTTGIQGARAKTAGISAERTDATVYVVDTDGHHHQSSRGVLEATTDGAAVTIDKDEMSRAVLGPATLQSARTGSTTNTGSSSLVLFDSEGKVLFRAP